MQLRRHDGHGRSIPGRLRIGDRAVRLPRHDGSTPSANSGYGAPSSVTDCRTFVNAFPRRLRSPHRRSDQLAVCSQLPPPYFVCLLATLRQVCACAEICPGSPADQSDTGRGLSHRLTKRISCRGRQDRTVAYQSPSRVVDGSPSCGLPVPRRWRSFLVARTISTAPTWIL
jgi:hypothetical protein